MSKNIIISATLVLQVLACINIYQYSREQKLQRELVGLIFQKQESLTLRIKLLEEK